MTTVALNKLTQWDGNVRKTNAAEGIEELSASIAAHGLLNPLTVKAGSKGKYEVVAGQRRLMALQALAKAGKMDKDAPIDCSEVAEDADLMEISLAENVVRTAMHPADQFDAWRDLADKGLSPMEIAARFGVSELTVTKRLKLGRVSPRIMQLYRDGKIGLQHIEAFTVSDDHAEQERVWDGLDDWSRGPAGIRKALTNDEIPASDKRVRLVTLDAYEAAGGAVRRDLFDDRNAGYVSDAGLLDRLVAEKLETVAADVRAEGWKWVEVRSSFERYTSAYHREFASTEHGKPVSMTAEEKAELKSLQDEQTALEEGDALTDEQAQRLEKIEARIEQLQDRPDTFPKAVLKRAGAVITLGYNGLEIVRGLVLKADAPKAKDSPVAANDEPVRSPFSKPLLESLTKEVTGAMQAELVADPRLALIALLHKLCTRYGSPMHVSFSSKSCVNGSLAEAAIEAAVKSASAEMPDAYNNQTVWDWLARQDTDKLLEMLAIHLAQTLDASERDTGIVRAAQRFNLREWFTPDAENYFGKVSREQIFADIAEMEVSDADLKALASLKKGELAKAAAKIAADTDWLPVPMRLAEAAGAAEESEDEYDMEDAA